MYEPRALPPHAQATDAGSLGRLFGRGDDVLPLWIAEPYVPVAPAIVEAVRSRAATGWFGYEMRPDVTSAFWEWKRRRQAWSETGLTTMVSPSVATSIGVLLELHSEPGDGVVLQPPVFTDFKPLIQSAGRVVKRAPLAFADGRYEVDIDAVRKAAADASVMILCSPHNPVGRTWTYEALATIAAVCAEHDVFVIADEIHSDLVFEGHEFVPFAAAAAGTGARWAALHGPIKTFGLAGLCDTFLITDDDATVAGFSSMSDRLHLTRNNVVGLVAAEAAYSAGDRWLDELLAQIAANVRHLSAALPDEVRLVEPEATYLAWLDLRDLGLDVAGLGRWLATEAGLALSPGHWFGREGAGFARMTIAVDAAVLRTATDQLVDAVRRRG